MQVTIREETAADAIAIRHVNVEAFGRLPEASLVDLLRGHNAVLLSLVAAVENRVVGHILYSPVRLGSGPNELHGAALAPMAVLPQFQRHGIGSQLVAEGTRRLREANYPFIVVLGHPGYYPHFGFVPASRYGVRCQWQVADDAFMLLPLNPSCVSGMSGLARYRDEFAAVASDAEPPRCSAPPIVAGVPVHGASGD